MKGWSTTTLAALTLVEGIVFAWHGLEGWREEDIQTAQQVMRAEFDDPRVRFTEGQLTGDRTSGQTCGRLETSAGVSERFIVYVDARAPLVDGGLGRQARSQSGFEDAWRDDCLRQGYNAVFAKGEALFLGQ